MSGGKSQAYPVGTIAKLLLLTERRVQQLAKEGVIPKAASGRYEFVPVVQSYVRYLRDRAVDGNIEDDYGKNRSRLTKLRADAAEIELRVMEEKFIPIDDVEHGVSRDYANLRAKLQQIAPKVASRGASLTNPGELQDLVNMYVREALEELRYDLELEMKQAEISAREDEKERREELIAEGDDDDGEDDGAE